MNKTSIKNFLARNEKKILIGTGIVIGSLTTSYVAAFAIDGMQLVNADVYEVVETGQKILRVTMKNGQVRDHLWAYTEALKA